MFKVVGGLACCIPLGVCEVWKVTKKVKWEIEGVNGDWRGRKKTKEYSVFVISAREERSINQFEIGVCVRTLHSMCPILSFSPAPSLFSNFFFLNY